MTIFCAPSSRAFTGVVTLAFLASFPSACDKRVAPDRTPIALPPTAAPVALPTTPEPSAPPLFSAPPSVSASSHALDEAPPAAPDRAGGFERRCGWVDNPTPANWWLIDRDATWEIGVQGGHQAEGDMPDFGRAWVETNGHYGYGCACVSMRVDKVSHRVLAVRDAKALPLARCRGDKTLKPHP